MMTQVFMIRVRSLLAKCAGSALLLGSLQNALAQSAPPAAAAAQRPAAVKPVPPSVSAGVARDIPPRERMYYEGVWGIDSLTVKYTESGEMIRFSYRVIDPAKAAPLNNDKAEPSLVDPQLALSLVVPQMENIGKLRQGGSPVAGRSYWIAFSNSGRRVRPGHRVNVDIGNFHAQNLVVE
jgi:hypothetical protein